MSEEKRIEQGYRWAREQYAGWGVETERALERLNGVAVSLPCWQGDDVGGFERAGGGGGDLGGGGIAATGRYPGKARSLGELRSDLEAALRLIPGMHRVNLHACYLDNGGRFVERDAIGAEHFGSWIEWAQGQGTGLDFNPTFFGHPQAAEGFTLSHRDAGVRKFWVAHGRACRRIAAAMGRELGRACVNNVWIPDGYKDLPVDRKGPRERLAEALDAVFAERLDERWVVDSVEGKLFGIGVESYTAGSHEFYLGYAATRGKWLCLDTGHFHPTEAVSDKISAVLGFVPGLLLHLSRPVRWDSDHVVILDDELVAIAREVVRGGYLERVRLGLDYFDASINRVAAWVIGARGVLKAVLGALLEPTARLEQMEREGDYTGRLALLEEAKGLPWGAVWDEYCRRRGVPAGEAWLEAARRYEVEVLSRRV